jgi:hypothetical protein
MRLSVTRCRLLVLQAVLSSVACLAQAAPPSQLASSPNPLQAATSLVDNIPCQAVTGGSQQLAPLAKLCEFALNYQQELPDFLAQTSITESQPSFKTVVTGQVALKQGHESYTAMTVNGKPVEADSLNDVPKGSMRFTSSGEFGAFLVDLFHPGEAEFQFRRQDKVNGTPVVVYDFHVSASSNTFWSLTDDLGHTLHPEFQGELWVEAGTGRLMRESLQPVHLPADFEITALATTIDYGLTAVGDAGVFVLASRSESRICTFHRFSKVVPCVSIIKTFSNYEKFAATTRILADGPQQ